MTLPAQSGTWELRVEQLGTTGHRVAEPIATHFATVSGEFVAIDLDLGKGRAIRASLRPSMTN
jgi:hypothetical protein